MVEGFIEAFEKRIEQWHNNFTFELKAEILEEVLVRTINDLQLDFTWKAGSHTSGVDIVAEKIGKISVKSGKENKDKITISSSRTTKYKSIEEKILFYKEVENSFDNYFLLSKNVSKNDIEYNYLFIPKENLTIDKVSFRKENFGWYGEGINYYFTIIKNMSDQIWIFLDKDYFYKFKLGSIKFHKENKSNGLTLYKKY